VLDLAFMKRILSLLALSTFLVGCESEQAIPLNLSVQRAFAVKAQSGKFITFEEGVTLPVTVTAAGSSRVVTIAAKGQRFSFRGARLNADGSFSVAPAHSGVRLGSGELAGLEGRRDLACGSGCERTTIRNEWRNCTVNTGYPPSRVCWGTPGGLVCTGPVGPPTRSGSQQVEVTQNERDLHVTGRIYSPAQSVDLATFEGDYTEVTTSERYVSACF
jgi:hypothetical protein